MPISKARLKQIEKIKDKDINYSDIPELNKDFWANAQVVTPPAKVPVSLRLDKPVFDWFKSQGKGYQTLINSVLSTYVHHQSSK